MPDCNNGTAEFDINDFGRWVEENYGKRLTLYTAKYIESIMRGKIITWHVRATGKEEARRLLKEYIGETLDAV